MNTLCVTRLHTIAPSGKHDCVVCAVETSVSRDHRLNGVQLGDDVVDHFNSEHSVRHLLSMQPSVGAIKQH